MKYKLLIGTLPYNSRGIILESDQNKALKYSMSKLKLGK